MGNATVRMEAANREAKDSVFCDLFSREEYLVELYRELHPEDDSAGLGDVELVTLERILTRGQYNDLGFIARGRLVVLVEAQSTWTVNVAARMLFYLADTYRRLIAPQRRSVYQRKPLALPVPEFYVVYTGGEDVPPEISFARDVLGSDSSALEMRVRVIRGGGGLLGQYAEFTREFDAAVHEHGRTVKAVEATVDACVERDVLREYLLERRKEVVAMMYQMLDREEAMAVYEMELREEAQREGREKGMREGMREGREKGMREGRREGRREGLQEGLREGLREGMLTALRNLIANTGQDAEQAMDALGIPQQDRPAFRELLADPVG